MSLIQTIQTQVTESLKSGDRKRLDVLRFIVSQVKYRQIETQRDITDEDVITVIRKQIKELAEAAEQFGQGGRQDLVEENEGQINILKTYLPQEISDEELLTLVKSFVASNEAQFASNPKALTGKAVAALKSKATPERIVKMYNTLHL